MKSKRGSNKIYYYIDLFFILAPIILLLFAGIWNIIVLKNNGVNMLYDNDGYSLYGIFTLIFQDEVSGDSGLISNDIGFLNNIFALVENNTFAWSVKTFINNILSWIGVIPYDNFGNDNLITFISYYFTYLISYEIFSLFINIIMWLPRWCRNKVRDWSGSDSV